MSGITYPDTGAGATVTDAGNDFTATTIDGVLDEIQADNEAHLADATDAHDASAISIADAANDFTATDVEGALAELQSDNEAHLADTATYFSYLAADSADVNNSTDYVDSGLTVTLTAAGTYFVDLGVVFTTAATPDLKMQLTGTATVTSGILQDHLWNGTKFTAWETQISISSGAQQTDQTDPLRGYIVVSVAGSVKLQFSQKNQDVSNTHLDSGSYLRLTKVA